MAFPVVQTTNTSAAAANNSPAVALPAGGQVGDLLLVKVAASGSAAAIAPMVSFPAGWNVILDQPTATGALTNRRVVWAARIADGTEGSSVTVTLAGNTAPRQSAHNSYRISGHDPAKPPEADGATGGGDTPDPPSLSPTGGADDYLFIGGAVQRRGANFTAPPANYSGLLSVRSGALDPDISAGSAWRQVSAASEDPGPFTSDSSVAWTAETVAVYGAEAEANQAEIDQTLPAVEQTLAGGVTAAGETEQDLPALEQSGIGAVRVSASVSSDLPAPQQSMGAGAGVTATIDSDLPGVEQSMQVESSLPTVSIDQGLPVVEQSASAAVAVRGAVAQTLPAAEQVAGVVVSLVGVIEQFLPTVEQRAEGVSLVIGRNLWITLGPPQRKWEFGPPQRKWEFAAPRL